MCLSDRNADSGILICSQILQYPIIDIIVIQFFSMMINSEKKEKKMLLKLAKMF